MSKNINTFSENMTELTKNVTDTLSLISGYGEAAMSEDSTVDVQLTDGTVIKMPSTANLLKRIERAEDTVATFVEGDGVVETQDGTFRKIKVTTLPKAPTKIENISPVSTFNINANWFFEDFMFPKCVVSLDLKGKIDDNSDRVFINRIILDYTASLNGVSMETYYNDNIKDVGLTYTSLIEKLNTDSVAYSEDTQEISLPLQYEKYDGEFLISSILMEKDINGIDRLWYYLDTINYKQVDKNGVVISSSYRLSKNDYIRYNDSLFKIVQIDQNANKIALDYMVGYESPAVGSTFNVYNEPFREKIAEIAIGFNEINILYLKGINENYNIVSKEWSEPINFITNQLTYNDTDITLSEYYPKYVMDMGSEWIAKAKQRNIYAYNGNTPNTPNVKAEELKVVQINTQLEATLNTDEFNNLVSSIATSKSNVEDIRKNIVTNKETIIKTSDANTIKTLQNTINNDTAALSTATTQYNSLVEQLNTLLNENGALSYSPKYHIRGFVGIPEPVYTDNTLKTGRQEVIGFDIMYRYIHTDNTGVDLSTFTYTNNNKTASGVFSDWNMVTSKIKEQVYDEELDAYVWQDEEEADGSIININQIDIPIRSGEKVQIKMRSISEAGYPSNPLKSDWSETVTISFPDNLTGNDSVTNIIDSAKDDKTAVVLQETMSAAGVYTHLSDSTNEFKHNSDNIFITYEMRNEGASVPTKTTESITSLLIKILDDMNNLSARVAALE